MLLEKLKLIQQFPSLLMKIEPSLRNVFRNAEVHQAIPNNVNEN